MAKEITPAAQATPELPGLKRRGRPATGKALTNAQRQARYRARNKKPDSVVPGQSPVCWEAFYILRDLEADMCDLAAWLRDINPGKADLTAAFVEDVQRAMDLITGRR